MPLFDLYDYQEAGRADAEAFLLTAQRGDKRLYSAPTGSGKSILILALLRPGRLVVTPFIEIVAGFLEKLGETVPGNDEAIALAGQRHGIWTPIRLRNKLATGEIDPPDVLIFDEVHHEISDSWQEVSALCGNPPKIGFTATPYRGTPRSTAALRAEWGEPTVLLTLADAVKRGVCSFPAISVEPLLDDDIITVSTNGEFDVRSVSDAIGSRIGAVCDLIGRYYDGNLFDKPTMVAVPSSEVVGLLLEALRSRGVPALGVVADTNRVDRQAAFRGCLDRTSILVQIKVVSEGVDLKIKRLIDLKPTLSPMAWVQQVGRIMRPGGDAEYVCCCRNLFRHSYLLDGLVPLEVAASEAAVFGNRSSRGAARAIGLEAIGKFKSAEVPYGNGLVGSLFALTSVQDGKVYEYAIITHPLYPKAIAARRIRVPGVFGPKWELLPGVPEIGQGYSSVPGSPVSPAQLAWWKRSARHFGLDENAIPTRKNFIALPVFANTRVRFK
jgi:hypothetical protein